MVRQMITESQALRSLEYLEQFRSESSVPQFDSLATFSRACILLNGSFSFDQGIAVAEADAFAGKILDRGDENLGLDPYILTSHGRLLSLAGLKSQKLDALLAKIGAALSSQPDEVRQVGRIRHMVKLLNDSGFAIEQVPAPDKAFSFLSEPSSLIAADAEVVGDFVDHVAADATELGTDICEILALLAVAELRSYRVDIASRILRLLLSQEKQQSIVEDGVSFVALQRTSNGSYGFFDPFNEDAPHESERHERFHLPITLNAVWLMFEFERTRHSVAQAAQ